MARGVGGDRSSVIFLFFPWERLVPIIQETPIGQLFSKEFI